MYATAAGDGRGDGGLDAGGRWRRARLGTALRCVLGRGKERGSSALLRGACWWREEREKSSGSAEFRWRPAAALRPWRAMEGARGGVS